jgi:hypothetical protein
MTVTVTLEPREADELREVLRVKFSAAAAAAAEAAELTTDADADADAPFEQLAYAVGELRRFMRALDLVGWRRRADEPLSLRPDPALLAWLVETLRADALGRLEEAEDRGWAGRMGSQLAVAEQLERSSRA